MARPLRVVALTLDTCIAVNNFVFIVDRPTGVSPKENAKIEAGYITNKPPHAQTTDAPEFAKSCQ
jgi:hypothetical protein